MKKRFGLRLALVLALVSAPAAMAEKATEEAEIVAETEAEYTEEDAFADWNPGAPALEALIDYVETVTEEDSEDYIPPADRIAVFDMDGTVYGELFPTYLEYYMLAWRILKDPSIQPDAEMLAVGRTLRDCALDNSFPSDMPMQHAVQAARAYAGLTLNEFADFETQILNREVDGFEGMTYGEAFYAPIIEVVDYLRENDFEVYLVSGSDRFICRTLIEGVLDIPPENVIGMDVSLEATGQNGADGLEYVFAAGDDIVRTDRLLIKNLKMNKVRQIVREIGHQPVLSFGNSSGDVSMHMYTISNNKYKAEAFMLIADDDERDYGIPEKALALGEKWEESGFHVISMKNDFRTIYGDQVKKTGSFHWLEELADDRDAGAEPELIPSESPEVGPAPDAAAEPETEDQDVQYVLYLGTNAQGTDKPVYTEEQSKEVLIDILLRHFGGYTIQEAYGGWTEENGDPCREYTLVVYLSDTTLEEVHAAANEMLETFDQSSVLIQTNPTVTEFYAG